MIYPRSTRSYRQSNFIKLLQANFSSKAPLKLTRNGLQTIGIKKCISSLLYLSSQWCKNRIGYYLVNQSSGAQPVSPELPVYLFFGSNPLYLHNRRLPLRWARRTGCRCRTHCSPPAKQSSSKHIGPTRESLERSKVKEYHQS